MIVPYSEYKKLAEISPYWVREGCDFATLGSVQKEIFERFWLCSDLSP
jgi:hypothetical protein